MGERGSSSGDEALSLLRRGQRRVRAALRGAVRRGVVETEVYC